jgi:hypothetical protein
VSSHGDSEVLASALPCTCIGHEPQRLVLPLLRGYIIRTLANPDRQCQAPREEQRASISFLCSTQSALHSLCSVAKTAADSAHAANLVTEPG